MSTLQNWALASLVNSIWQIPLIFCAAWLAARLARPAGPHIEHRIWAGAVLLGAILPLCPLALNDLLARAWRLVLWTRAGSASFGQVRVLVGGGTVARPIPWMPAWLLSALAAAWLLSLAYFLGRLAWGIWKTEFIRRRARSLTLPPRAALSLQRSARLLGLRSDSILASASPSISGPATMGIARSTLLFPPGLVDGLTPRDLDALLAHELAHMRRHDFAKNLFYGFLSIPVAYHPLQRLARARLDETRELVCDAMAAEAVGGRDTYAQSLLRLAAALSSRAEPRILHAIGILDANIFERRIMSLAIKSLPTGPARRLLIVAACAVLALTTCATAMALRLNVSDEPSNTQDHKTVNVKPDQLKIVKKVQPVYPKEAKASGDTVNGTVELAVILGKDGSVENIKVSKSLRDDYDQSAIDAVRQWQYEPFLLNGEPVEVKTTVNVTYSLSK